MATLNITSLSSKGQIVIPNSIRKNLHLKAGTKLSVISDGNNILLHPIQSPKISEFKSLINESRKFVKENSVSSKKLKEIIKKVRNENNS